MAKEYLDYNGLSHFKDKLDLTYAEKVHTHIGTDVTLTGYTKPSTASAIEATDTVDVAIGKLEKAIETSSSAQVAITNAQIDAIVNGTSS